ncbi:MAG: helix-turn-helix domain-containing protein, partial [Gracilibacteraceae bacterium]|nr:helix-turn-helix domain-containing protein [Gracilibacteraceae bacterium]
ISEKVAFQIVSDISEIINQHVNLMDHNGIIIASTDPKRVGSCHGGAFKVISEQLKELVVSHDGEYEGARKGINVPVMLNGEIVGVIGVTGEYSEVSKYSQITKKMTEILLLENYSMELNALDDRIKQQFFENWLFDERSLNDSSFLSQAMKRGIDITLPRRVLAVEIQGQNTYADNVKGQRIIESVYQIVRMVAGEVQGSLVVKTASFIVALIADTADGKVRAVAEKIKVNVKKIHNLEILIGMDGYDRRLNRAFIKAKKALRAARNFPRGICSYKDITLETFTDEISSESKKEFIQHLFGNYNGKEIDKWMALLKVYFSANGSINHAAEQLFIHKNTLQYHLKKLGEITGRDPRNITDAALFYLAYHFYDDKEELLYPEPHAIS